MAGLGTEQDERVVSEDAALPVIEQPKEDAQPSTSLQSTDQDEGVVSEDADLRKVTSIDAQPFTSQPSTAALHRSPSNRVITKGEICHFADLGLGCGVDATDPKPWLNKSPFRVRHPTQENTIGIDEGDLYQGFVTEIESNQDLQATLSASVPLNRLVTIGIDAELSRSYSKSQKAIGRKLMTRTVSFTADFDDIVKGCCRVQCDGDGGEDKKAKKKTFELRLMEWICHQLKDEEVTSQGNAEDGRIKKQCIVEGRGALKRCKELIDEMNEKELYRLCSRFINTHAITHYICAIQLGACHFRIMTQEEFKVKVSGKSTVGVAEMADAAIGGEGRCKWRKHSSKVLNIGHITKRVQKGVSADDAKEMVARGKTDEAVVGVKLQPISSLVLHQGKLRKALQEAIQRFINDKQNVYYGPFYISCINCKCKRLFLKVSEDLEVKVTRDIKDANKFHIVRSNEEEDHFQIVYKSPIRKEDENMAERFDEAVGSNPPVAMYLYASINWFSGKSSVDEPLKMRSYKKGPSLALRNRISEESYPAKLTEWVNGQEDFFINCQERSIRRPRNSYLCIYRPSSDRYGPDDYITGCRPHIDRSEDPNVFTLFRLSKSKGDKDGTSSALPKIPQSYDLSTSSPPVLGEREKQDELVQV